MSTEEHRPNAASSPHSAADLRRSDSQPATPSDALPPDGHPALPHPVHYRTAYASPAAGYWPMSYDHMRLWAGLQMQQYMMDARQSDHGHSEYYHEWYDVFLTKTTMTTLKQNPNRNDLKLGTVVVSTLCQSLLIFDSKGQGWGHRVH